MAEVIYPLAAKKDHTAGLIRDGNDIVKTWAKHSNVLDEVECNGLVSLTRKHGRTYLSACVSKPGVNVLYHVDLKIRGMYRASAVTDGTIIKPTYQVGIPGDHVRPAWQNLWRLMENDDKLSKHTTYTAGPYNLYYGRLKNTTSLDKKLIEAAIDEFWRVQGFLNIRVKYESY